MKVNDRLSYEVNDDGSFSLEYDNGYGEKIVIPKATAKYDVVDDSTVGVTVSGREYYFEENGKETISVQEAVIEDLIGWGVEPDAAFCIATGCKYIQRAGKKSGESAESDIEKAGTYFYRALCGEWPDK